MARWLLTIATGLLVLGTGILLIPGSDDALLLQPPSDQRTQAPPADPRGESARQVLTKAFEPSSEPVSPVIRSIRIIGNAWFERSELLSRLRDARRGRPLDQIAVLRDVIVLQRHYSAMGFPDAEASLRSVTSQVPGTVDLVIAIDEGDPRTVDSITIEGLSPGESRAVRLGMTTRVGGHYEPGEALRRDREAIAARLRKAGYSQAAVRDESRYLPDTNLVAVRLTVRKGRRVPPVTGDRDRR